MRLNAHEQRAGHRQPDEKPWSCGTPHPAIVCLLRNQFYHFAWFKSNVFHSELHNMSTQVVLTYLYS